MPELAIPVGLGLASRGDLRETVEWAKQAEAAGLESVWVHDSYFEREPVSLLATIAHETREIRIGAGSLNPYTRHPLVLAQTLASLDDLAPDRIPPAPAGALPPPLTQWGTAPEDAVGPVARGTAQAGDLGQGTRHAP